MRDFSNEIVKFAHFVPKTRLEMKMVGCNFLECEYSQKEDGKEEHCIKHGIPCRNIRTCQIYERLKSGKTELAEVIDKAKAEAIDEFAMSIVAICRLEKCSMWDVFERFNIPEKMQKEIAPIVANNLEVYEKIFDKVDEMSDEEFIAFARKMEGKK